MPYRLENLSNLRLNAGAKEADVLELTKSRFVFQSQEADPRFSWLSLGVYSSSWSPFMLHDLKASSSVHLDVDEPIIPSAFESSQGIAALTIPHLLSFSRSFSPATQEKIGELLKLKANWDGEGAKPIRPVVIANVLVLMHQMLNHRWSELFQEPFIAPTCDGFVQLEWHNRKKSLDIEASENEWIFVGSSLGQDKSHQYFTGSAKLHEIDKCYNAYGWFVGDELLWPFK